MPDNVFLFYTYIRQVFQPVCDLKAFISVQTEVCLNVFYRFIASKSIFPEPVCNISKEPFLEENIMIADDGLEVSKIHEKTQCLHGIISSVAEISDRIQSIFIRIKSCLIKHSDELVILRMYIANDKIAQKVYRLMGDK